MFDEAKARHVLRFFRVVLGVHLPPWAKKALADIFGTVKADGRRQYRVVYLEIPGRNGKSVLLGGLGLYLMLYGGEDHNAVYCAAASKDQTRNIFINSLDYTTNSRALSALLKPLPATKEIRRRNDLLSFYRAISADGKRNDGLGGHVLVDELHRWSSPMQHELWGVIKKAGLSLREPLRIIITTAGAEDESPLCLPLHNKAKAIAAGKEKDDTFYSMVFGLDPDEDWHDEQNWIKVNPSLKQNGGFLELEAIRALYNEANGDPVAEHSFRRLHLNTWLNGNIESVIKPEHWKLNLAPVRDDLTERPCYLALDLATREDLAALVAVWPDYETDSFDARCWCWKPSDSLSKASKKDSVPYRKWADQGWLSLSEGPVISVSDIVDKIKELNDAYDVRELAVDPWQANKCRDEISKEGIPVIDIRQNIANMTGPTKYFLESLREGKFRTDDNPMLSWCASCLALKADDNGNVRPAKPDIRKSTSRIDLVVALIMALDRAVRNGFSDDAPYADHEPVFLNLYGGDD